MEIELGVDWVAEPGVEGYGRVDGHRGESEKWMGVMAGVEPELEDPVWVPRLRAAIAKDPVMRGARAGEYLHWAKSFLWFCRETGLDPDSAGAEVDFAAELGQIGREREGVERALVAVAKLKKVMADARGVGGISAAAAGTGSGRNESGQVDKERNGNERLGSGGEGRSAERSAVEGAGEEKSAQEGGVDSPSGLEDWERVRGRLEAEIHLRHYSRKTLKTYAHWINGFARFLKLKEPEAVGAEDARDYLEYLAMERKIAASTQNQAFNSLLFLFEKVLGRELTGLEDTPRAKKAMNVPEVMSREEVNLVLEMLEYPYDVFFTLCYGCGLRLGEALSLRVQDVDTEMGILTVHRGKGGKSRRVPFPRRMLPKWRSHMVQVKDMFEEDRRAKSKGVFLTEALERKLPGAPREWPWYWAFPAKEPTWVKEEGGFRRFHIHESLVQKALKETVDRSGLSKRVTAHTFRHSYATHLIMMGMDIRTLQDLMGHGDVKTTQIYTQAVRQLTRGPMNPLDGVPAF